MWNCYNNVLGRLEKNINDVEMRISYWLHHSSISKSSWKIPISFTMNAITVTIVSIFSYKHIRIPSKALSVTNKTYTF